MFGKLIFAVAAAAVATFGASVQGLSMLPPTKSDPLSYCPYKPITTVYPCFVAPCPTETICPTPSPQPTIVCIRAPCPGGDYPPAPTKPAPTVINCIRAPCPWDTYYPTATLDPVYPAATLTAIDDPFILIHCAPGYRLSGKQCLPESTY